MADDNVSVRFGADTGAVKEGGAEVKGVLAGIGDGVKALVDAFLVLGGAATGSFREMRAGAAEAGAQIKETAEGVKEFREAVAGIGEALIAAFAVEQIAEFAKKMAETAEQVSHTATTFGLATGEVQQLKALASGAGIPFEALTTAMQRSDRALTTAREGSKQAAEAFKLLGINIHQPIGQTQLLQQEIAGLANIQDVPTRIGIAMQLFGRNIQNIAPLIGLTKEQLDEINQSMVDYGVRNDDAQQKGQALAEAFNTNKIAMQGLGETLTQALAPAFTEIVQGVNELIKGFIESYNQGGAAKVVLDAIVLSVKLLAAAASLVGAGLVGAFDLAKAVVDSFSADWKLTSDLFINTAKQMADQVVTLGKVIYDSLTNNVLQAAQDMKSGWATMQADAKKTADDFAADFAAASRAAAASVNAAMDAARGSAGFIGGLFGTPADDKNYFGLPNGESPTGSGGGAPPNLGGGKKGGGESQVGKWTEELHEQELKAAADTGDYMKDQTAMEVAFWQQKLSLVTNGSKEWYAVQDKLFGLLKTQASEAFNALVAGDKEKISADKGNITALTADWQKYVDDVTRAFGAGSAQAENAQREMTVAIREAVKQQTDAQLRSVERASAAQQHGIEADEAATKTSIETQIEALRQRYDLGEIGASAYFSGLEALHQKETDSALAAVRAQIAAVQAAYAVQTDLTGLTLDQALVANDKYVAAVGALWSKLNEIVASGLKTQGADNNAAVTKFKQQWDQTIGSITQDFGRGLLQMAEGATSFGQLMANIGNKIAEKWVDGIAKMVSDWAAGMALQLAKTHATNAAITASNQASADANLLITMEANLKKIAMDAKTAAAGAYNWAAAWGGPIAGAIAAAVAFAGVMAFGSFDKGVDVVPNDMIAQVHAGERIMPAADNSALMGALRSLGSLVSLFSLPQLARGPGVGPLSVARPPSAAGGGDAGPWGGGSSFSFGDTHITTSSSGQDIRAALREHRGALMDEIDAAFRNNRRINGWSPYHR